MWLQIGIVHDRKQNRLILCLTSHNNLNEVDFYMKTLKVKGCKLIFTLNLCNEMAQIKIPFTSRFA